MESRKNNLNTFWWKTLLDKCSTEIEFNLLLLEHYPKVMHFPNRDQSHALTFQLVGFDAGTGQSGASTELDDFEFKLAGLWQFIPVCRTPCISVHKNFNQQRLKYIKQADPAQRVKFLKASHLPLLWKDAPLKPFRFNPKGGKDQGHPAFVQIKAKFLPEKDVFVFQEQLDSPKEKAPRFLKTAKKDKAEMQRLAKDKKRNEETKGDWEWRMKNEEWRRINF